MEATVANLATPPFLGDDGTDVMMGNYDDQELMRRFPPMAQPPMVAGPSLSGPPPPDPNAGMPDFSGTAPVPQDPASMSAGPAGPAGPGPGYQDALTKLEGLYGDYPQRPQPKWWQRALGAVAGAGAGWSNAASRTRNPIDIGAMRENILAPGYEQKLAQWQSRVTPAQTQAGIEGQKQEAWWKQRHEQTEEDYRKAMGVQAMEHGAYWKHRAEMEQNQWKIDAKTGTLYNTVTGERSAPPPTPKDRYATAKALSPNMPEDEAQYYALNGNLSGYAGTLATPPKPEAAHSVAPGATLVGPDGEVLYTNPRAPGRTPQGSKTQFRAIEAKKNDRLLQAQREADKQIAALGGPAASDEDKQPIFDQLERNKQMIQDGYESEINAAGGEAEHFAYGQQRPAGRPQPAAAPTQRSAAAPAAAAGAGRYTEAQVREAAAAKGKDPDAAVRIARERKLIP
jgi:hypothetical protein